MASSHYIEEGQWDDGGGSGWTDSTITCITLSHGEAIQVTYSLKGKDTDYVGNPGKANSYYIQEGPWGSLGGGPWTDGTYSTITSIILRHGDIIDAIQVVYSLKGKDTDYVVNPGQHGGSGGDSSQINFEKDEFLTKIEGHLGNYGCFHVIRSLTFTTNKKTYGPYGSQSGNYFTSSGKGKIVGFYGHSGIFLDRLGVYTYLS